LCSVSKCRTGVYPPEKLCSKHKDENGDEETSGEDEERESVSKSRIGDFLSEIVCSNDKDENNTDEDENNDSDESETPKEIYRQAF